MPFKDWIYGSAESNFITDYGQTIPNGSVIFVSTANTQTIPSFSLYRADVSIDTFNGKSPEPENISYRSIGNGQYQDIHGLYLYVKQFTNAGTVSGAIYAGGGPSTYVWDVGNIGQVADIDLPGGIVTNSGTVTGAVQVGYKSQFALASNPSGSVTNSGGGIIGSVTVYNGSIRNQGVVLGGAQSGQRTTGDTVNINNSGTAGYLATGDGDIYNTGLVKGHASAPLTGTLPPNSGTLTNNQGAIQGWGAAATVVNSGSIAGAVGHVITNSGTIGEAVVPLTGVVFNQATGLIGYAGTGVKIGGKPYQNYTSGAYVDGSVTNLGTISNVAFGNNYHVGVTALTVANGTAAGSGALISGYSYGALLGAAVPGFLTNYGTVTATGTAGVGVAIVGTLGGALTNHGTISATGTQGLGVHITAPNVNVTDYGAIVGQGGTAVRLGGAGDRLIAEPGATFAGTLDGGSNGILELGNTPAGTGTIAGTIVNFAKTYVDNNANWTLTATDSIAAAGALNVFGTLTDNGVLTNAGSGQITPGGQLAIAGTFTNSGSIYSGIDGLSLTNAAAMIVNKGTITGHYAAIVTGTAGGTIIDYGTIAGGGQSGAVQFGGPGRLIVEPGAVFTGSLNGGGGTLELAGTNAYSALVDGFTNFDHVIVDRTDDWDFAGTDTIAPGDTVSDIGTMIVGGVMTNRGTIAIGGSDSLFDKDTLINYGSISSVGTLAVTGTLIDYGTISGEVTIGTSSGGGNVQGDRAAHVSAAGGTVALFGAVQVGDGGQIVSAGTAVLGIFYVSVTNLGLISGTGSVGVGVYLVTGGTVTNGSQSISAASIQGYVSGVASHAALTTITNYGTIQATGSAGIGVTLAYGGSVTNGRVGAITGAIHGAAAGVFAAAGGAALTVRNYGAIVGVAATGDGILSAAQATIANQGSISGGASGILLPLLSGTVFNGDANHLTASIYGTLSGIATSGVVNGNALTGGAATITNWGSITSAGTAISLADGGSVINKGTQALIQGAAGAVMVGTTTGGVTNYGGIVATGAGALAVTLNADETLSNYGSITATGSGGGGVLASGDGFVFNGKKGGSVSSATVSAASGTGIYLSGQETGRNYATVAAGAAKAIGVKLAGSAIFRNYGRVAADYAVILAANNSMANYGSGTIVGGAHGVTLGTVSGQAALLANAGSISGTIGVYSGASGVVKNNTGGQISGINAGLATAGTASNYGTITGSYTAVTIYGSGAIYNISSGYISGVKKGVVLAGDGTVHNHVNAIIKSKNTGLYAVHGGTINNDGTIEGFLPNAYKYTRASGVYLNAGGALTDTGSGYVYGGQNGLFAFGPSAADFATIANAGTIKAGGGAGVILVGYATLTNTGTVTGYRGIRLSGGTVMNYGTITANATNGVAMLVDATNGYILNKGNIYGKAAGIDVTGTGDTIVDTGTITTGNEIAYSSVPGNRAIILDGTGDTLVSNGAMEGAIDIGGQNALVDFPVLPGGLPNPAAPIKLVNFTDNGNTGTGTVEIDNPVPATLRMKITQFGPGDKIELVGGPAATGLSYSEGFLSVGRGDGSSVIIQVATVGSSTQFSFANSLGNDGNVVTLALASSVPPGALTGQVAAGQILTVSAGQLAVDLTIESGGSEVVAAGGTDRGAVLDGGSQSVFGNAVNVVLDGNAVQTVESGGFASFTTVSNTDTQTVLAGGTASGSVVSNGGVEIVSSGATDTGTTLTGGGQSVFGTATSAMVGDGSTQTVGSGGVASFTTVSNTGTQTILAGGTASGSIVASGGFAMVSAGGTAVDPMLAGGTLVLSSGSTAFGAVSAGSGGGTVDIVAGGVVVGGTSGLTISAGSGADTVNALAGGDTVEGGVGTALVFGATGDVVENASGAAFFTLSGGLNPSIFALSGGALLYAGSDDTLMGGGAMATVVGATGDDFVLGGGADTVNVIPDDESLTYGAGNATVYGGVGDTIGDSAGTVVTFDGGSNAIVLAGSGSSILLYGGPGDTLTGGSAAATVIGSANDEIMLGTGADTVNAFPVDEVVELGGGANETIYGGTGDTIEASGGGALVTFESGAQGIVFAETAGANQLYSGPGDTLAIGAGSLDVIGAAGNTLTLGDGTDTVNALPPNEVVTFGTGNATIFGGDGDTIGTASGADVVFTGGNNAIVVEDASGAVTVDDGAGDTIAAGAAAGTITGARNSSIIMGGAGDTVTGANGDTITTGAGSDSIDLGASHTAAEFLAPGSGADTSANDTVVDFNEATGDRILVTGTAETNTIASAQSSNGNTTITLSDGSTVTLVGVSAVNSGFFS